MSGRGKGGLGLGLGKGQGKRHRKVHRDNIQGITKPAIRRLARRAGVKRIDGLIYEETRGVLKVFLENIIRDAITFTEHAKRKTVSHVDILYGLQRQGGKMYFGGVDKDSRTKKKKNKKNLGNNGNDNNEARESSHDVEARESSQSVEENDCIKVITICNNSVEKNWIRTMKTHIKSKYILLDCIIEVNPIVAYLKSGFEIIATPEFNERTKEKFINATSFTVDELLEKMGYAVTQSEDNLIKVAKTLCLAYWWIMDKKVKIKNKLYLEKLVRTLEITGDEIWTIDWMKKCVNSLQEARILVNDSQKDIKRVENTHYAYYFTSSLNMRYTTQSDILPLNHLDKFEVKNWNSARYPGKLTEETVSGICGNTLSRDELKMLSEYAENIKKKVYMRYESHQNKGRFWVAVELGDFRNGHR